MRTPAGRRDTRIAFERATTSQDEFGAETATWATLGSAYASVRFGTSAERREAAAETGSQAATFRVLATAITRSITLQDRIAAMGSAWDIKGIAPIRRTEIEITAVRAR